MKNKSEQNRQSTDIKSSTKKGKKEHLAHPKSEISKNNKIKIKSPEKMITNVDENIQKELEQNEQEKKPKIKIFNNKKIMGFAQIY